MGEVYINLYVGETFEEMLSFHEELSLLKGVKRAFFQNNLPKRLFFENTMSILRYVRFDITILLLRNQATDMSLPGHSSVKQRWFNLKIMKVNLKQKVKTSYIWNLFDHKLKNKKVLLQERKRHTVRRVASAWGTPPPPFLNWPSGGRGTYLGKEEGYLTWGTPHPDLAGGRGYQPWTGEGYQPWDTPSPPPPGVGKLTNRNYYLPPSYGCRR